MDLKKARCTARRAPDSRGRNAARVAATRSALDRPARSGRRARLRRARPWRAVARRRRALPRGRRRVLGRGNAVHRRGLRRPRWRVRPLHARHADIGMWRLRRRALPCCPATSARRASVRLREGSGRVVVDWRPEAVPLFEEAPFLVTPSGYLLMRDERWRAPPHAGRRAAKRQNAPRAEAFVATAPAARAAAAAAGARARRICEAELGPPAARAWNCVASRRRACGARPPPT